MDEHPVWFLLTALCDIVEHKCVVKSDMTMLGSAAGQQNISR